MRTDRRVVESANNVDTINLLHSGMGDPLSTNGYKNVRAPCFASRIDGLMLSRRDVSGIARTVFLNLSRDSAIIYYRFEFTEHARYVCATRIGGALDENEIISVIARQSVFNSALISS